MSILMFLFVGLIAGWIASHLVEGYGLGGLVDTVVGIVGAFIGGFIFDIIGITAYGFLGSVAMSALGATTLLVIVNLVTDPRIPSKVRR